MTETTGNIDWMKDWKGMSRQYWDAWQDLTRQQMGKGFPDTANTPWHEGLEQWSRMFGQAHGQNQAMERLMSSAKGYMALMQSMIGAAANGGPEKGAAAWTDALRNGFNMPGLDATLLNNPVAHAFQDICGKGAKGFEQMMSGLTPLMTPMVNEAKSWLNMPAFGFLREHQEQQQKMAAAFVEYQEHVKRYNALLLKASQRGFEIFQDKLAAREEPGRQIDSMRALYDLWVDSAEEAYAEIALSEEFRAVYGEVVNSQMRVRSHLQQEVERIAGDFGMPTRTEINSMGQRLQEVRRDLKRQAEQQPADFSGELALLRKEMAMLKAQLAEKSIGEKPIKKNAALRVVTRKVVKTSKLTKR